MSEIITTSDKISHTGRNIGMSDINIMSEILAPAGNAECAEAAINAGADAIYLGFRSFSARAGADNFDADALHTVLEKAHFLGVKVYVAMNTLVKDTETAVSYTHLTLPTT